METFNLGHKTYHACIIGDLRLPPHKRIQTIFDSSMKPLKESTPGLISLRANIYKLYQQRKYGF